ncbi:hypothetical protein LEP1GSC151_2186 [Leptospira interrogans serovar Grippotyphosa str. LT2186]|uniref:Tetratricopeptide repeat protein n=1 Tax=Leptospira interrogans serovar Grippotyphosa str. LT2186 TaxID=1001599 RepID=M3IBC0_LEPIR|nr:hypothetical protein LEP1GSC151_2186 [Leptospira interrogans serovar Grippotyphosa str. LT2186]
MALIYYYQGEQFFRMGNFVAAFEFFGKSAGLLENPSLVPKEVVGLADDPYSRKEDFLIRSAEPIFTFDWKTHKKQSLF